MPDEHSPLSPRRRAVDLGLGVLAAIAIGVVDLATGPGYGLSLFYLVPVIAAGWRLGKGSAIGVAVTSAVAGFLADYLWFGSGHEVLSTWDGVSSLVIYLGMGLAASRLREDRDQMQGLNARLKELLALESETARTDALTRLPNRRGLLDHLEREIAQARRQDSGMAVMFVDLDNFKRVNDVSGHAAGDRLLQKVSDVLRASIRAGDLAARIGGDEFAVVLSPADPESSAEVALRLRERLEALRADHPGSEFGGSIGIALFERPPRNADDAIGRADAAMYLSKTGGKGRVTLIRVAGEDLRDSP